MVSILAEVRRGRRSHRFPPLLGRLEGVHRKLSPPLTRPLIPARAAVAAVAAVGHVDTGGAAAAAIARADVAAPTAAALTKAATAAAAATLAEAVRTTVAAADGAARCEASPPGMCPCISTSIKREFHSQHSSPGRPSPPGPFSTVERMR